jgi:hypothetical protein
MIEEKVNGIISANSNKTRYKTCSVILSSTKKQISKRMVKDYSIMCI